MGRRHCSAYNFRAVPQHGRDHCYLYAPDRQCEKACENADVAPLVLPIRGGTDGCQLSFMYCLARISEQADMLISYHEHITVEGMDKSVDVVTELVKLYAM